MSVTFIIFVKIEQFMYDVTKIQDQTNADGTRIIYANTCAEVCSKQIGVAVKDDIILEVGIVGGCSGNSQGVASLIKGMTVDEGIRRLEGIRCGGRPTSCPDQLARTLKLFKE